MKQSQLKDFFFAKTDPFNQFEGSDRYVPQSYNGGTGWGVYDRKTEDFVDDRLNQIGFEALMTEKLPLN